LDQLNFGSHEQLKKETFNTNTEKNKLEKKKKEKEKV